MFAVEEQTVRAGPEDMGECAGGVLQDKLMLLRGNRSPGSPC